MKKLRYNVYIFCCMDDSEEFNMSVYQQIGSRSNKKHKDCIIFNWLYLSDHADTSATLSIMAMSWSLM